MASWPAGTRPKIKNTKTFNFPVPPIAHQHLSLNLLINYATTYLVRLVEEQTEVCENNPQLLPSIARLKFPQQFSTHLILEIDFRRNIDYFHTFVQNTR